MRRRSAVTFDIPKLWADWRFTVLCLGLYVFGCLVGWLARGILDHGRLTMPDPKPNPTNPQPRPAPAPTGPQPGTPQQPPPGQPAPTNPAGANVNWDQINAVCAQLDAEMQRGQPVMAATPAGMSLSDHWNRFKEACQARDVRRAVSEFRNFLNHLLGEEVVFGAAAGATAGPAGARGDWLKRVLDLLIQILPLIIR